MKELFAEPLSQRMAREQLLRLRYDFAVQTESELRPDGLVEVSARRPAAEFPKRRKQIAKKTNDEALTLVPHPGIPPQQKSRCTQVPQGARHLTPERRTLIRFHATSPRDSPAGPTAASSRPRRSGTPWARTSFSSRTAGSHSSPGGESIQAATMIPVTTQARATGRFSRSSARYHQGDQNRLEVDRREAHRMVDEAGEHGVGEGEGGVVEELGGVQSVGDDATGEVVHEQSPDQPLPPGPAETVPTDHQRTDTEEGDRVGESLLGAGGTGAKGPARLGRFHRGTSGQQGKVRQGEGRRPGRETYRTAGTAPPGPIRPRGDVPAGTATGRRSPHRCPGRGRASGAAACRREGRSGGSHCRPAPPDGPS